MVHFPRKDRLVSEGWAPGLEAVQAELRMSKGALPERHAPPLRATAPCREAPTRIRSLIPVAAILLATFAARVLTTALRKRGQDAR
jgi:hypothetical protein